MGKSAVITQMTEVDLDNMDNALDKDSEHAPDVHDPNRKPRIRSLFIVHIAMLILSLGSSIIYTGVWPYIVAVRQLS